MKKWIKQLLWNIFFIWISAIITVILFLVTPGFPDEGIPLITGVIFIFKLVYNLIRRKK